MYPNMVKPIPFKKHKNKHPTGTVTQENNPEKNAENEQKKAVLLDDYDVSELNFISGIIRAEDDMRMKRMIFRASRGRALPTFFDLTVEDKLTHQKIEKKIFTIFYKNEIKCYNYGRVQSAPLRNIDK